jgi:hypothetical protein
MMRAMRRFTMSALAGGVLFVGNIQAQQPTPPMIIVQAANAPTATPVPAAASAADTGGIEIAIKALEQVKAANEAMLKKQEAMLQQLDELQKAAEQLKVFSKRV